MTHEDIGAHEDIGRRPKGATETYKGYEVWDHGVWPVDVNQGVTDGEVDLTDDDEE